MARGSKATHIPRRGKRSGYDNNVNLLYEIRDRIEASVPGGARNCPNIKTIDRVLTALRLIEAEKDT